MTNRQWIGRALSGLLCGAAIVLVGCQSSEGRQAKVARRAITSLDTTRQELVKADLDVNQTLASMDELTGQPRDLKQAYKAFATEVSDTAKQSREAQQRADQMRDRWQEYITSWEREADRLDNE
ncbi:MAG: hypothetical protein ABFE01_27845, partial [Phycisphaerales bacterium]